jgi:DNA repair protein RecN (Recombination protein N)
MQDEAALARRVDMLGYQIEEIRATNPQIGEDDSLKEERTRLANAEQLASLSTEVRALLIEGTSEGGSAAVDLLSQASMLLTRLAKVDPSLNEVSELADSLSVQVEDLADTVRDYGEKIEYNPTRLNETEERLEALNRLKRKYGGSLEAVLAFRDKAQQELQSITNSEARIAELEKEEDALLRQIGDIAFRLSNRRQKAAITLGRSIEAELQELRMGGAKFEVSITQVEDPEHGAYVEGRRLAFDITGIDQVEFMMSANPGEPIRPMAKVASGGETARIMLALKTVLSRADQTSTLIFDEIDQGIGGRVGATVGRKLWGLSADHQVLCVTHLAQLAGYGDLHLKVSKTMRGDRTATSVRPLTDPERVIEIAEMLGSDSESGKQSALDIITIARNIKAGRQGRGEAAMPDSPPRPIPTDKAAAKPALETPKAPPSAAAKAKKASPAPENEPGPTAPDAQDTVQKTLL